MYEADTNGDPDFENEEYGAEIGFEHQGKTFDHKNEEKLEEETTSPNV